MRPSRGTRQLSLSVLVLAVATACGPDTLTVGVVQYNDQADGVVDAFTEELRRLVADRPITFVHTNGGEDRAVLVRETTRIIGIEPDIVVAMGGFAAVAVRDAVEGTTVPTVIGFVSYSVAAELIDTLSEFGGEMTGVATLGATLASKGLETLINTDQTIRRVLFLHSNNPIWPATVEALRALSEDLGIELLVKDVATPGDAATTLNRVQRGEVDAVLLAPDQTVLEARDDVRALSRRAKIPVFSLTSNPVGGATMSLGADAIDSSRQLAVLAAKVLRGTPPVDLPVEVPRRVLLRLYADNAREAGYTFTPAALAAADEMIGGP